MKPGCPTNKLSITRILHLAVETAATQTRNLPIALALRVAHHAGYKILTKAPVDFRLVRAGGLGMQ